MKKVNNNEIIDVRHESTALYEFTKSRWEGLEDHEVQKVIEYSFEAGLNAGKYWVDSLSFMDIYTDWMDQRCDTNNWSFVSEQDTTSNYIIIYDDVYKLGYYLTVGTSKFKDIIMMDWDFSDKADKLAKEVLKLVPHAKKYKPKGYAKLRKGYRDHDGFEEYDQEFGDSDFEEFKGVNSSNAGSGGYHDRIALPSVMYDDVCQGRNPLRVLTSSAFAHGLHVASHNNSAEILLELKSLKDKYFQPEYFREITFLGDLTKVVDNKIFKAILLTEMLSHDRENTEYHDQTTLTRHINQLVTERLNSPILSSEQVAENKKKLVEMLKSAFSKIDTPEEVLERGNKKEAIAKDVIQFLNGADNKLKM